MSNSLSTSRSCQKLLLSGTPSTVIPATGGPSIQAQFEEPTMYTVEFRVSNQQNINVPAGNVIQQGLGKGNITPTATLQWSLGGNTIYRKCSVFSGVSISGVCEQLVASVSDETILPVTFQVGINLSLSGKPVIGVNTVALVNVVTSGFQTINGVSLTDGMTVLLTAETSLVDNGIYIVHAGAWSRLPNLGVGVHAGGAYTVGAQGSFAGQWWVDTDINGTSDVVGTDSLHFAQSIDPTYQQQYSVTIVGGEGTRPATALPPTYQKYFPSFDGIFRYGCVHIPAGGDIGLAIPQDIGITSLMVNAGPLTATASEAVTADNFLVQLSDYTGLNILSTYFPLDRDFVPLPSQAALMTFFNLSTTFDMIVSIMWGIDG
jgi:hypothetical protein